MSSGFVLVIGLTGDPVVSPVLASLARHGAATVHWNPRELTNDLVFRCRDGSVDGWVLAGDDPIPLRALVAVFNRMSSVELTPEFRALPPEDPLREHAVRANANLAQWCEVAPVIVINRGLANESNSAKAYQAQIIRAFFDVPDTLVTNNVERVRRFADEHGRVIYKSCSGERSIVTDLDLEALASREEALRCCPVLFQQWVDGIDVRVHVVGAAAIATAVRSASTDYRYDPKASWRPYHLTEEQASACVALARIMDLDLAGIDLRIAPDGRAYCFEVNPSPAFSVYEDSTGQQIADAVARHLMSGDAPAHILRRSISQT